MLPLGESSSIGQRNPTLSYNVISALLGLLQDAWTHAFEIGHPQRHDSETTIAAHLVRAIHKIKSEELNNLLRVHEEVTTRSDANLLKPDGRVDLMITYNFRESDYFGIECKRIRSTPKDLAKKYVDNGVARFVNGKYSKNHSWGAMVGFVIDGDPYGCADSIENYLLANTTTTNQTIGWREEKGFGEHPYIYRTGHKQVECNNEISLLHLFLIV